MAAMKNTPIEVKVRVGLAGNKQITIQIDPTRARDELIQQLRGLSEPCLQINLKEFTHVCVIGEKAIWPDFSNLNDDDVSKAINNGIQLIPIDKEKRRVLNGVNMNGYSLRHARQDLKNDRYVVMVAVKESGDALEFASEDLRNNREVVMEAVKESGDALRYASEALKADRDVVLAAVGQTAQ
jgi:hypothetical protein